MPPEYSTGRCSAARLHFRALKCRQVELQGVVVPPDCITGRCSAAILYYRELQCRQIVLQGPAVPPGCITGPCSAARLYYRALQCRQIVLHRAALSDNTASPVLSTVSPEQHSVIYPSASDSFMGGDSADINYFYN
jgi:hypothetical protein